jgi:uncharacterized OB-fold protein
MNQKPLPHITPFTRPFWDAARAGTFILQRCRRCRAHIYYPRPWCPHCWHTDLEWVKASGRGRVITYSIVHQPPSPAFAADTPYVLAVTRLDEGPQMMANVLGIEPAGMRIDLPVRVIFEERADGFRVPQFAPADA